MDDKGYDLKRQGKAPFDELVFFFTALDLTRTHRCTSFRWRLAVSLSERPGLIYGGWARELWQAASEPAHRHVESSLSLTGVASKIAYASKYIGQRIEGEGDKAGAVFVELFVRIMQIRYYPLGD